MNAVAGKGREKLHLAKAIEVHLNATLTKQNFGNIFAFAGKKYMYKEIYKFILHVYINDFLVFLHPSLRQYLGFKHGVPFGKGSHWAWSNF